MKNLSSNELRKLWLDFWKRKNHEIIESASLIPHNDPSLLWINAGVAPLKKYFDGSETPSNPRMANIQKCIRTNDIENVGKTARHQTFFEMLGNFSIGDYFKKEAITWSFEFLTSPEWLGFPKEKLYITVYTDDEEAYNIWTSLGIDPSHIIKTDENFWEIGPGPSGPCSEIFYDRGEEFDPENIGIRLLQEDIENDRYIEIWNNVFSMYNAKEGLSRSDYPDLPQKNIDTGMGFERVLSILQNGKTNFDTDVFLPIIEKVGEISRIKYEGQMPFKVIADHVRTITFALADGASFGNTGRNYVLRRLLRRAVRYGKVLGINEPFLGKLVPVIVDIMKDFYTNLEPNIEKITQKIEVEEKLFHQTLASGEKRLQELFQESQDKHISGEEVFKLYDTYGFPFELTLEYATEAGYTISREEFDIYMERQREMARSARSKQASMNNQNEELLKFNLNTEFVGYDTLEVETKIIALFDGEKFVDSISNEGYIVLEKTPFYVESGGQVTDEGTVTVGSVLLEVIDAFKAPNGQYFYYVKFDGEIFKDSTVVAKVDEAFRRSTEKNHSAVHLIQKALQDLFGPSVKQAGSKVDSKTLRFDFTCDKDITKEEIIKIEEFVNNKIKSNSDVKIEYMALEEAKKMGAMALFEEKYGDVVRVVTIGDSIELCGGTHVKNSSEIEKFSIFSFESKGSGVYRIAGATSNNIARELFETIKPYNDEMIKLLTKAKEMVSNAYNEGIALNFDFDINHDNPMSYKDVLFNLDEVKRLKQYISELEQEYMKKKMEKSLSNLEEFEKNIVFGDNINYLVMKTNDFDITILKGIIDALVSKHENLFVFIANVKETSSINFISKANVSLKDKINCGILVKDASVKVRGNGGGNPLFAQGGGSDITNLDEVMASVLEVVKSVE